MLLGDLNINLDVPRNEQKTKVAAAMDHHGMVCAFKHFTVRRRKRYKLRGIWTRKHRRLPPGRTPGTEQIYRLKPDHFLMPWKERRRPKRCRFTTPLTHSTVHRALVAQIYTREKRALKAYRRKLGECPLKVTDKLSADEKTYAKLAKSIPKADPRDLMTNN